MRQVLGQVLLLIRFGKKDDETHLAFCLSRECPRPPTMVWARVIIRLCQTTAFLVTRPFKETCFHRLQRYTITQGVPTCPTDHFPCVQLMDLRGLSSQLPLFVVIYIICSCEIIQVEITHGPNRSGVEIDPVPPGILFYGKLSWAVLLQSLSTTTTTQFSPFP